MTDVRKATRHGAEHTVGVLRRPRRLAVAGERPLWIVAYIQAGATLWDHGIRPVALFGSQHDGAAPDPARGGELPLANIRPRVRRRAASGHPAGAEPADLGWPSPTTATRRSTGWSRRPRWSWRLTSRWPVSRWARGAARGGAGALRRARRLLGQGEPMSVARELDAAEDDLRQVCAGPVRPRRRRCPPPARTACTWPGPGPGRTCGRSPSTASAWWNRRPGRARTGPRSVGGGRCHGPRTSC